jgi:DNA-binding IclR family transcriptional regulator
MKFFSLANRALAQMELREQATPHLRVLARTTQLTAQVAILEQGESLILSKIVPVGAAPIATWTGKRIQTHCTALGKALIAYMHRDKLQELVRERGLVRHSENTITSLNKLILELEEVRNQHWALNDEESAMGTRCVAAPVLDHLGNAAAAISVSGTVSQITPENCGFLAESAKAAALALSRVADSQ